MKAQYDDELIELTDGFLYAVKLLMKEEIAMMKAANPEYADCWHWGRCTIGDLSSRDDLRFEYGSLDDMPDDDGGQFAIVAILPGTKDIIVAEMEMWRDGEGYAAQVAQ